MDNHGVRQKIQGAKREGQERSPEERQYGYPQEIQGARGTMTQLDKHGIRQKNPTS